MRKTRLLSILATGERSRGEFADPTQEAQIAVAALQASAQGENTTYTVKHIQKGLTLFVKNVLIVLVQPLMLPLLVVLFCRETNVSFIRLVGEVYVPDNLDKISDRF